MRYEIVPTTLDHISKIASSMRASDRRELMASVCMMPYEALFHAFLNSECSTGLADGDPICVFGVRRNSLISDAGTPWMLGTDDMRLHSKALLRKSRSVVSEWKAHFDRLENWVDARNTESIRWLRWLGFTIHPAEPFGPFGYAFHRFDMRRS